MTTYGIGEYRMRNGGKAVVEKKEIHGIWALVGMVDGKPTPWTLDGYRYFWDQPHEHDLIAPWEEPAPEGSDMTEHPMITAQRLAENSVPLRTSVTGASYRPNTRKAGMIAALKWLEDPANLSDAVIAEGRRLRHATIPDIFTVMIRELRKEIEGHEKGGAS